MLEAITILEINMDITIFPDGRLSAKDAATYVGLSYRTLSNHRVRGTGPRFVKRGVIFYYKEDLEAWLGSGKSRSTAEARQKASSYLSDSA